MKLGSACVSALLRRKRCVRRRLAKGVLFVATRVCPRRVAIAGLSFFLSFLPPMEGEYHLEWSVGDLICSVLF